MTPPNANLRSANSASVISSVMNAVSSSRSKSVYLTLPNSFSIFDCRAEVRHGKVIRGYLGIKTIDIDPVTANLMNLGGKKGLIIQGIDPDGPAAKGGLQSGDIVISIEDQNVLNAQMAMDIIAETKPGSVIDMVVLRDGVEKKLKITVAEDLLH